MTAAAETKHTAERLRIEDLFEVKSEMPADTRSALTAYLSLFANPKRDGKHVCINCDANMDGLMAALGVGAAYRWGIAHGEASCSSCGWPARGMHYIKDDAGEDICSLRNVFLPYHPDEVSPAKSVRS